MSRIGKQPIAVPEGVQVDVEPELVRVKGPKGELSLTLVDDVTVESGADGITVAPRQFDQRGRAMWGLSRSLVANLVTGVSKGFERRLEISGVGYRAAVQGRNLNLSLGYSHDVVYPIPEGISVTATKPTELVVAGIDKQRVGQVAAEIREFRPPEPYKGKGVKYAGEKILRKEGKKK